MQIIMSAYVYIHTFMTQFNYRNIKLHFLPQDHSILMDHDA